METDTQNPQPSITFSESDPSESLKYPLLSKNVPLYLETSIDSPDIEMEVVYGKTENSGRLTKPQFMKLIQTLRNTHEGFGESTTLDIRKQYVQVNRVGLSDIRITIEGVSDIRTYCKTNDLTGISCTFVKKQEYKDPKNPSVKYKSLQNTDYNYRVNLKTEEEKNSTDTEVAKVLENLSESLKYFRYKKRFSFLTSDKLFRIDVTAVKTSEYKQALKGREVFQKFSQSGILKSPEFYEIEIEYIGSQPLTPTIYPIDEFVNTILSSDKHVSKHTFKQNRTHGSNLFSDAGLPTIPTQPEVCEFPEMIQHPEPSIDSHLTDDPMSDIRYDFWVQSDLEWIPDMMANFGKGLTYMCLKENTTATYKDAPENETYAEYMIYPQITEEEKEEYQEIMGSDIFSWPASFGGRLLIPISEIQGTPESHADPVAVTTKSKSKSKDKHKDIVNLSSKLKETEKKRLLKVVLDAVLQRLDSTLEDILCLILDTDILVSQTVATRVIRDYHTLTEQSSKDTVFMGPDPVTLTLNELNPENVHSVLQGYVVTEKADGLRAQLLISKDKHGYLVRKLKRQLVVIDTGVVFENVSGTWLFDGEYITNDKNGNKINLYMIFDVYWASDGSDANMYPNHAFTYPWSTKSKKDITRSRIVSEFKRSHIQKPADKNKTPMRIGFKTYLDGPRLLTASKKNVDTFTNLGKIGKLCKHILEKDQHSQTSGFGYRVDGLIFMPMCYPVKSMNEHPVDSIRGRWYANYKWKPPEENTIDFKVKIVQEMYGKQKRDKLTEATIDGTVVTCKQVSLIVSYDELKDPTCDFAWKMLTHAKHNQSKEAFFNPIGSNTNIHLCDIPLRDGKLLCERDNVELQDNMIVEMSYEQELPEGSRWVPLRERPEKTYGQANDAANNIWSTIVYPVTERMITGKDLDEVPLKLKTMKEETEAHAYYVSGDGDRDSIGGDKPLRKYHNLIKQKLITSICSSLKTKDGISILDTSVGRGGDIGKYLGADTHINFFLGLDISSNIGEAAKRYYTMRMRKPKAMFIQYDTSEPIHTGEGCIGSEKEIEKNKHLIDILYKNNKSLPKDFRSIEKDYRGLGEKGFDLISSQFTIHYYFKDEITLRGYLQNLSDNCRKGGYFIGTCYDGMKVFQTLQEKEKLEMIDECNEKIYSITKKYELDDFTYSKDNKEPMFGQEIDVYMSSIGQTITEYLVNFEMFIDLMDEYGFRLATPHLKGKQSGIFDHKDFTYQSGFGGFEKIRENLANLSSKDPSIKRRYPEALQILQEDNQGLRNLSDLNNWFIFQKV